MPALLTGAGLLGVLTAASWWGARFALAGGARTPLTARPEHFGLSCEPVEFQTTDGVRLRGWFIRADPDSDRTILLCHGWGTNKGEILKSTHGLCRRGFNLLYFDFRCCGESGGEVSSVGTLEALDFDAAAKFLRALRPGDRLGVYGLSMGAMVAFCGLTRHAYFRAAALESPFASHAQAIARYGKVKTGLPYYPLIPLVLFWIRRGLGVDPESTSPERAAHLLGAVPLLVICGELDRAATPEIGRTLLDRVAGPSELWVVPRAGHARCAETAGKEYVERLARFYGDHL